MVTGLLGDDRFADDHSDELDDVLSRALADDSTDRYDSLLALADALRWAVR